MIVYKYVIADRIEALINASIRFSQTSDLNDPFENAPSTIQYRTHQYIKQTPSTISRIQALGTSRESAEDIALAMLDQQINDEWVYQSRKFIDDNHVFLCLTRKRDNLLMWSHYAESHHGFAIGFDAGSSFFQADPSKGKTGLKDVIYSNMRYRIPEEGLDSLSEAALEKAIDSILLTKSRDWAYEREVRMIAHPSSADETIKPASPGPGRFDICLFRFPHDAVLEIIAGAQMFREKKKELAEVAKSYPNAKLLQANLDDLAFKMRVSEPLDDWLRDH